MIFKPQDIRDIADKINNGQLGIVATDTLWGFIGLATEENFERLSTIKNKKNTPFLMLTSSLDRLKGWCPTTSRVLDAFMDKVWPGPTTLLLPAGSQVPGYISQGRDTIGVRVPSYIPIWFLLTLVEGPVFSTSVNLVGEQPVQDIKECPQDIVTQVDFVCTVFPPLSGTASAIVDCSVTPFKVIRGQIDL